MRRPGRMNTHRHGQALTEYGLAIMAIALVVIIAIPVVGFAVSDNFGKITSTINSVIGGPIAAGPTDGPGGDPPRVIVNPPLTATVNCGSFTPGSNVDITLTPESGSPVSILASTTADENGNVVDFVVNLPADAQGNYSFGCNGNSLGPPMPIQPSPPPPSDPIAAQHYSRISVPNADSALTMQVAVNDCASAYVRTQTTVQSQAATLLSPGATLTVEVAMVNGGNWGAPPNTPWYTCDGQGHTWYRIASGTYAGDYIFTGGVHQVGAENGTGGGLNVTQPAGPGEGSRIAGTTHPTDTSARAFVYDVSNSTIIYLDSPAGENSSAIRGGLSGNYAVGDCMGSLSYPCVWNITTGTATEVIGEDYNVSTGGISGSKVVGQAFFPSGDNHAFVYDINTGQMTDLDPLSLHTWSSAYAINGSIIAGSYIDNGDNGQQHPFLYDLNHPEDGMVSPTTTVSIYALYASRFGDTVVLTTGFVNNADGSLIVVADPGGAIDLDTLASSLAGHWFIGSSGSQLVAVESSNSDSGSRQVFTYDLLNSGAGWVDIGSLDNSYGTSIWGASNNLIWGNSVDAEGNSNGPMCVWNLSDPQP